MPKITGFEILELIEDPPHVIFTTAFDEYAMQAFEAKGVDYLLKPFSQQRFDKAISKWMELRKAEQPAVTATFLKKAARHPMQSERIVALHVTVFNIPYIFKHPRLCHAAQLYF